MNTSGPWSLAFVALVFASYGFALVFLRRGARLGWPATAGIALAMCAWLGATGMMAGSGFLVSDVTAMPPLLLRFVVGPALLSVLVLAFMPPTGRFLDKVPGDWLVSYQGNRILVELILHGLFTIGLIHQRLTFAGANFDIVTGLLALPVGYLMHKGRAPRWLVLAFNLVGLVLLFTIVTMALLSAPTPLQHFNEPPALRVPFHVPFVWLPGFIVPLALLAHLLSIRKWVRDGRRGADDMSSAT